MIIMMIAATPGTEYISSYLFFTVTIVGKHFRPLFTYEETKIQNA